MSWLLIQIWSSLAVAALLGLVFGWAVRGIGLKARLRRLMAERDLIGKDRDQLREDLDKMYASRQGRNGDATSIVTDQTATSREIAERDERLKALGDELNASKQELGRLREEAAGVVARAETAAKEEASVDRRAQAAVASTGATLTAAAPSVSGSDKELEQRLAIIGAQRDELTWRNRYLESRVRMLEETIEKLEQRSGDAISAAAPELASQIEQLNAENEKLRADVDRLRSEVADGNPAGRPAQPVEAEQELARLRWRNRYLESRLDYLEGNPETAAEEAAAEAARESAANDTPADASKVPPEGATSSGTAASLSVEDPMVAPSSDAENAATSLTNGTSLSAPVGNAEVSSNGGASSVEMAEPPRLSGPREEGADTLAAIEGVGPMIERALNQLGIYHLDQVANWGREEAIWVDRALGFNNGRVLNDDWAGKARKLIGA